jgi:type IV fimbrial biogenesis protein FimT
MDAQVGVSKCRGFTLLELLVTLSIAAILLAVGVPSYVTFIDNNRVTSQANDLLYGFNMARSEAIKRGAEVRLVSVAGSDWSGGSLSVAEQTWNRH